MTNNIILHLKCKNCNYSLMDDNHKIDGVSAIKLKAVLGKQTGYIYLSSIYGSYNKEFENLPDEANSIYEFFCPYCNKALDVVGFCECRAPIVSVNLNSGGSIKFCSRNGCKHHSLEFEDLNDAFQLLVNNDPTGLG